MKSSKLSRINLFLCHMQRKSVSFASQRKIDIDHILGEKSNHAISVVPLKAGTQNCARQASKSLGNWFALGLFHRCLFIFGTIHNSVFIELLILTRYQVSFWHFQDFFLLGISMGINRDKTHQERTEKWAKWTTKIVKWILKFFPSKLRKHDQKIVKDPSVLTKLQKDPERL